ncbi:MAG: YncE family protein [Ignavibacteria bacterium]
MKKLYLPIIFILSIALTVMIVLYIKKTPEEKSKIRPLPAFYNNLSGKYDGIGRSGLGYIPHISRDIVSVIDLNTNTLIGYIKCEPGADYIAFSPNGERGYITSYNSGELTVFDKKTNETIANVPAGENPESALVTQDNKYVLVSHESSDGIWFLNAETNKFDKMLDEGTGFLVNYQNGKLIYQAQIFTPYVFVIDPVKQEIIKRIEVGGRPMDLAFSPDYKFAYVPNYDLNEIEKINVANDSIVKRINSVMHARGIAVTPDGNYAYVANVIDHKIMVVDLNKDEVIKTIGVSATPSYLSVTHDGKFIYVTNQGASKVSVIDTQKNELVKTIQTADNGIAIIID